MFRVAVTGTNGKTSCTQWLGQALSRQGIPTSVIGTFGIGLYRDGNSGPFTETGYTTPDPLQLYCQLAERKSQGACAIAIEASSIGLAQHRIDELHIDCAVLTNFTRDHLDFHGTMQAYEQAKTRLFEWQGLQYAVINLDDLMGVRLIAHLRKTNPATRILGYSVKDASIEGIESLIAADILYFGKASGLADGFRTAAFQTVSIMTTTGFASADFDQWPNFSRGLLVALMFIGGCAGSTAGGVKVGRVVVFFKTVRRQMVHTFRPNQIIPVRINGVNVSDSYLLDVMFFLALTGVIVAIGTLAVAVLEPGFTLVSSFTAVAATLFNIGPGLDAVGPMMNYAGMGSASHLLLSALMIMGRLEIFAVLVLFVPLLWRRF